MIQLTKLKQPPPLPTPKVMFNSDRGHFIVWMLPRASVMLEFDAEQILECQFKMKADAYGQNINGQVALEMQEVLEIWLADLVELDVLWWDGKLKAWRYLL